MSTDRPSMKNPCMKLPLIFSVISATLLTLFVGCEDKPDFLGRNLLPSSDDFYVGFDSTQTICAYTVLGDSIVTNNKSTQLLGSYIDPLFGFSKAEIVTQIERSSSSHSFGENPHADSVVLYFSIDDYYGYTNVLQDVYIYEYLDLIRVDTSYYSNMDISGLFDEIPIGSGKINSGDTIASMVITDDTFINKVLTAEDSVFSNNDLLADLVKGLYISTLDVTKDGALLYINMVDENSKLTFYYSNNESNSLSYSFRFDIYSEHFNLFKHEHKGYPVEDYLKDNGNNDSIVFLQTMGGLYTILQFPGLKTWKEDSMPVAINQAELVLTPEDSIFSQLGIDEYPLGLNLYSLKDDGNYQYVYDYLVNSESLGGGYDEESNSYRFNIKLHVQSYLDGIIENANMILIPGNNGYNANRVILKGGNHTSSTRMKFKITYTRL